MTIKIYPEDPATIVLYQPEGFAAWKRVLPEGNELPAGNNKLALMGHIYGVPKPETIVSIVSKPEHEGAIIGDEVYAEGSTVQPLFESHRARAEFG